jgi:hypothetical protein
VTRLSCQRTGTNVTDSRGVYHIFSRILTADIKEIRGRGIQTRIVYMANSTTVQSYQLSSFNYLARLHSCATIRGALTSAIEDLPSSTASDKCSTTSMQT